ncbi:MAG: tail fiber domain-containing protein, partial [Opitutaceae bacterium]|nr:tail fiber domain-containing protein [Cytophagales bacterium]
IGTATPTERLHIYNGTAPYVLLESTGGAGKILGYKIRPWSGMAANTYAGFGGVDDALSSVRAAIYVPNAANTGVMEAVSILKSSGNVGINTTAPTSLLSVNGTADKAGGGTWGTFSDKRLKKDILDYNDGLSALLQIHPVKFKYNGKGPYKDTTSEYIGVIAQEIKKVAPYTVETFSMKLDQNDKSETTLLKYDGSSLTYMLINSVKELKAQIDVLKAENAIQKEELKSIQTLQYEISEIKKLLSTEASAAKNSK